MTTTLPRADVPLTTITFPEIALRVRDAHKLRGYFGNLFQEHSPLLHNHFEDGRSKYQYPLVQYKVLHTVPTLVGLGEGASLLVELFLKIKNLDIDGRDFPILSKHINHQQAIIGLSDDLFTYRFETLWLGLNQKNVVLFRESDPTNQLEILKRTAIANILTFFECSGLTLSKEQRILMKLHPTEPAITKFKNIDFIGFGGTFTTNALLPNSIGLGKSVARGFGSIIKI